MYLSGVCCDEGLDGWTDTLNSIISAGTSIAKVVAPRINTPTITVSTPYPTQVPTTMMPYPSELPPGYGENNPYPPASSDLMKYLPYAALAALLLFRGRK